MTDSWLDRRLLWVGTGAATLLVVAAVVWVVAGVDTAAIGSGPIVSQGETVSLPIVGQFPVDAWIAHWWVFPAAILFSLIALAAGVSSALFFSPFFLLVVGLTPAQAIGAGLLTMVFGTGNGLQSYVRQGVVDYATAKWLLAGGVPAVIVGAILAQWAPETLLRGIFGLGLLGLGWLLFYYDPPDRQVPGEREGGFLREKNESRDRTVIVSTDEKIYEYETCWRPPGVAMSLGGGLLTGLVSAGLPEILTTQLIVRCRLPPRVAIATSVFVMAIGATAGALVHALSATPVWFVVAWSIPGVIVGSTCGTRVGKYLPGDLLQPALGATFGFVGGLVLVTTFLL